MRKSVCRYVISLLLVGIVGLLLAGDAKAQCGVPGTPPCKKKTATGTNPSGTARRKTNTKITKPATPPAPEVYRPLTPLVIEKVGCYSPDIPNTLVKCPGDVKAKYFTAERDRGYDIAVVQYDNALLRDGPKIPFSRGTKCVSTYDRTMEVACDGTFLKRGDGLVILERSTTSDWLNVINLETGTEGWVYVGHVDVYFTRSPKATPNAFTEERSDNYSEPEITIKNLADRVMTLRLGRYLYKLMPNTERTVVLSPGPYKYYCSFPRAYPTLGEQNFSTGYRYTWSFYIERVVR